MLCNMRRTEHKIRAKWFSENKISSEIKTCSRLCYKEYLQAKARGRVITKLFGVIIFCFIRPSTVVKKILFFNYGHLLYFTIWRCSPVDVDFFFFLVTYDGKTFQEFRLFYNAFYLLK